jgi:hypothetical protein
MTDVYITVVVVIIMMSFYYTIEALSLARIVIGAFSFLRLPKERRIE